MTKPQPPPQAADPQCPDGPAPHAFPSWPYAWEKAFKLPDGLPTAKSAPASSAAPSAAEALETWRRMAAAPYQALWSAYAQGFQAWATLWDVGAVVEPPTPSPKPKPRSRARPAAR